MMSTAPDPHVGTWVLDPSGSNFDANHRPRSATLVIDCDGEGRYSITAEGISEKGEKVTEKPQTIIPDGVRRTVPDFPGLSAVASRPDPRTLRADVRREDGSIAGEATYVVSADGRSMTAISCGFDSQLRQFRQETMWTRQSDALTTHT